MHVFLYYSQWVSNLTSKNKVNVESAGILVEQKDLCCVTMSYCHLTLRVE